MTVNEALEKCISILKNIRVPVQYIVDIGIPIDDVAKTQRNIRAALEPPKESENQAEEAEEDVS